MFHYFVSYVFTGLTNKDFGFGCCEIQRDTPITGISDIQEIVDDLSQSNPGFKDFTVLSYQLMKEEPDTE